MEEYTTETRLSQYGGRWQLMGRFSSRSAADEDYGALLKNFPDREVRVVRDGIVITSTRSRTNAHDG